MRREIIEQKQRQRAPSQRALATRKRILDAAEQVFARNGFDGATLRDIAAEADEAVSLVHHHGGGKETLFRQVIGRRAEELSKARIQALELAQSLSTNPTTETILSAFITPLLTNAANDIGWQAYTRLIAHVSADERWRDIAAELFDPTALRFVDSVQNATTQSNRTAVATGFVYTISATLAHIAAGLRINALGEDEAPQDNHDILIAFCAAGMNRLQTV